MPSALLRTSTNSSFKFFVLEEKCLFYVVPLSYIESIVKRRPLADDGKNEKVRVKPSIQALKMISFHAMCHCETKHIKKVENMNPTFIYLETQQNAK